MNTENKGKAVRDIVSRCSEKKPFLAFDIILLKSIPLEEVERQISSSSLGFGSALVYIISCLQRNVNPEEKYIIGLMETMKDVEKSNEELYIMSLCFKIIFKCHNENEEENLFGTLEQTYHQLCQELVDSSKYANIAYSYFLLFSYYSGRDGEAVNSKKCANQAIQFMTSAKLMSESDISQNYQSALGVFCFEAMLYYLNDPRDNGTEIYELIDYLSNDQLIEISLELDIKILDSLRDGVNYSYYLKLRELLDCTSMALLQILLKIKTLLVEIAEGKKDDGGFKVLFSMISLCLQHFPSFFKFKVYNAIFAMFLRTYNEFTPYCLMVGKQMLLNIEDEYLLNQQSRPVIVLEMLDSLIYSPDIFIGVGFHLLLLSPRISKVSDVCDKYSTFWSLEIKKAYFGTMKMIYEKLGLEEKVDHYRKQYFETEKLIFVKNN